MLDMFFRFLQCAALPAHEVASACVRYPKCRRAMLPVILNRAGGRWNDYFPPGGT